MYTLFIFKDVIRYLRLYPLISFLLLYKYIYVKKKKHNNIDFKTTQTNKKKILHYIILKSNRIVQHSNL